MTIIECETEEQLKALKDKALKCKVIALHKIGKHPLYNPRNLKDRDRKKLFDEISLLFEKPIEELEPIFSEIACDKLFEEGDVSTYPVYDLGIKEEVQEQDA